jgi:hypothetical protein
MAALRRRWDGGQRQWARAEVIRAREGDGEGGVGDGEVDRIAGAVGDASGAEVGVRRDQRSTVFAGGGWRRGCPWKQCVQSRMPSTYQGMIQPSRT